MADSVVADTHALLWWLGSLDRLSGPAREALDGAATIFVSSISFWEVGMLVRQGRIALDRPFERWTNDLIASGEVMDAPVTAPIGVRAASLVDLDGDPADRLIAATAGALRVPLVTKDRRLHEWAGETSEVAVIW